MTEADWLACDDPRRLVQSVCVWQMHTFYELVRFAGLVGQTRTERRYRLFACGCMRQVWHLLLHRSSRDAVELAEQYADAAVSFSVVVAARTRIQESAGSGLLERLANKLPVEVLNPRPATAGIGVTKRNARLAAYSAASEASELLTAECLDDVRRPGSLLSRVFRDIFGNPFRPVAFDPAWRTSDVALLAKGIYDERAFDRMPILADALQDAGCDSDDILGHLRDPHAAHVRGCWALELVLGKE